MQQVGTTGKESSKKHATEGPLSKPRRTRRLEEKQIKPKERNETTKDSLKKRSRQPLWRKKSTKPGKPRTNRRQKQRFQAKKRKQTSIAVTKQIESEYVQLLWQAAHHGPITSYREGHSTTTRH